MANLGMARSFNDVWLFDTVTSSWSELTCVNPPIKRTQHVVALLDTIMLIHGGFNCEGKFTLDDFCLFDVEEQAWIQTYVVNGQDGKVIESSALYGHHKGSTSDSSDTDRVKGDELIGPRRGHCLVSVLQDSDISHTSKRRWIEEGPEGNLEGFYLFGGQGQEDSELMNDLWLIKPKYLRNKGMIDGLNFEYKDKDPELTLMVEKITEFKGQAPCPRYGATMVHLNLKSSGNQLLVIYGGRNDKIYEWTGSMTLNDICIFNINLSTWEALAMFGQMPPSRTNHTMAALSDLGNRTGFVIFGGTNQNAYCRNRIFQFTLMAKGRNLAN